MLDNLGYYENIYYFKEEGRVNISKTVELSIRKAKEESIRKILVFTSDGEGALELKKQINEELIDVIAVSFPNKMPFFHKEDDGGIKEIYPETSNEGVKKKLMEKNIKLVQGTMPFEAIIVPGARDSKIRAIKETLTLFSGGLKLCVQAVLMTTDSGVVEPGEKVIAMSADTSIITYGSNSAFLFHPLKGLHISKIICKPINLNISKQ